MKTPKPEAPKPEEIGEPRLPLWFMLAMMGVIVLLSAVLYLVTLR